MSDDTSAKEETEATSGRSLFGFPRAFWSLNGIETFERLAYFGVRSVVAVYIMEADLPGGLHFTAVQKGSIFAWWFVFQSVLPVFLGGFADRYGAKKNIFISVTINITAYLLMATMRSYWGFFWSVMLLASGTALFKPALQGSLSQTIHRSRSSLGWGIFYWVVNISAAVGPAVYGVIRDSVSWRAIFLTSAGITALNYLMLLTYRRVPMGSTKTEGPVAVLKNTVRTLLEPRLVAWLLIMSCFWLMMYQFRDLHQNFITDWIDSSAIVDTLQLPAVWTTETGRGVQANQEILLALNPALIIVLLVPLSWASRRFRTLQAMVIGMAIMICGVLVAGMTMMGVVFVFGIVLYSIGEMFIGPKNSEYLSLIAPAGKKATFLGFSNLPAGLGGFFGSKLAGYLYGHHGDRAVLAQRYLLEHTDVGGGVQWDGDPAHLTELVGVGRTGAFDALQSQLGVDGGTAVELLWQTYHPHLYVWIPLTSIGAVGMVSLAIFNWYARRWPDMDA